MVNGMMRHLHPCVVLALFLPVGVYAQEPKLLRWGMDATGGAPYVFDNNTKGFEVDLAAYLATKLGRVSTPVNSEWNKLPELLTRGDIDIVLNGYEYAEQYRAMASRPYYIYRLMLVKHKDDTALQSWEQLPARQGKSVGVLTGSAAARYMDKTFGEQVDTKPLDDVANTFDLVANKQFLATVQDSPAAQFYIKADAQQRLVALPEARAQGFYVILTDPKNVELRQQIDKALKAGLQDGTLEAIYRKYGLWNEDQERLLYWIDKDWAASELPADQQAAAAGAIDWPQAWRLLAYAAGTTIVLAVLAMPLAILLGLGVASGRLFGPRWLAPIFTAYVEVLRGTPLLLQLWVLFYLLPRLIPAFGGIHPVLIGVLGLALNYSASEAEHFRGSFLNIARGQLEAALSLGLKRWKAIRVVLMPQAVRAAVPSVTNDFVALFKDTAVCSVISVMELTKQYNTLYNNHRDHILTLAAITAGLYLLMSYPLAMAARKLEGHLNQGERN
jgi:polar amino acid transport system substrate-binding protein